MYDESIKIIKIFEYYFLIQYNNYFIILSQLNPKI